MKGLVISFVLIAMLLFSDFSESGESGEFHCTSCGYSQSLSVGGSKSSPSLTIYCSQCNTFSKKAFASWHEANRAEEFVCPKCSNTKAFVYRGQSKMTCPKCGKKTTRFKTIRLFD